MRHNDYSSERLRGIRRPPAVVSFSRIVGGLLTLFVLALGLYFCASLFQQGIESIGFRDIVRNFSNYAARVASAPLPEKISSLNIGAFLLSSLIAVPYIVYRSIRILSFGLRHTFIGLRELLIPTMPTRVPYDYDSVQDLRALMCDGTVGKNIYESFGNDFIAALFGKRSMFITPIAREIAKTNCNRLKTRLKSVLRLSVLAVCVFWGVDALIASGFLNAISGDLQHILLGTTVNASWKLLLWPIGGFIAAHIVLSMLEYLSTSLLIPRREPSTKSVESSAHYDGFGHPRQLANRLPIIAEEMRWKELKNRVTTAGFSEEASSTVGDTGSFNATFFIERQPIPRFSRTSVAATVLLLGGWGIWFASVFVLFALVLPSPIIVYLERSSVIDHFLLAPVYVAVMLALVGHTFRSALESINAAYTLFESARFRSDGVFIELEGVISRATLTIGKARDDSIESNNLVARSEFTARFWAGELTSEAKTLESKRIPLSIQESAFSEQWITHLQSSLDNLKSSRVQPLGIDVSSPELQSIVEANLQTSAMREHYREMPKRINVESQSNENNALSGPTGSPLLSARIDPTDDAYKECPECAEIIRARARKCRFCGFKYETSDE